MEAWRQLKLLLHRNFLLRKRQPVILCLELLWPIFIFLAMMAARWSIPPVNQKTCRYNSWALPTMGAVPFLQSFVCNIDNNCLNETEYEEIPFYPKSSIRNVVDHLNPLMSDEKITSLLTALPTGMTLLRTIVNIVEQPEIKETLDIGIPAKNILRRTNETADVFYKHGFSKHLVDLLLKSYVKLPELVNLLVSHPESPSSLCNHRSFHELFVSSETNGQPVKDIVTTFCNLSSISQNIILSGLVKQIDVENIVLKVSKVMSYFGRDDISSNLHDIAVLLQNLKSHGGIFLNDDRLEFVLKVIEDIVEGVFSMELDFALLSKIADDFLPLYDDTDWVKLKLLLDRIASLSERKDPGMSVTDGNTDNRSNGTTGANYYRVVLKRNVVDPATKLIKSTDVIKSVFEDDRDVVSRSIAILQPYLGNETLTALYRFAHIFESVVSALLEKHFSINCDVVYLVSSVKRHIQQLSTFLDEYFTANGDVDFSERAKNLSAVHYLLVGAEAVLLTIGTQPQKLLDFANLDKLVKDICTEPVSKFLTVPDKADDILEQGKNKLCRMTLSRNSSSSRLSKEECSSDMVVRDFIESLGTVLTTSSTHYTDLTNLLISSTFWENIVQKYSLKNITSVLRILHILESKLEEIGVRRPVFHTLHSILKFVIHKTENITLSSNGSSDVSLQDIFSFSPLASHAVESLLPHSSQIITTLFWSTLAAGKLTRLVEESRKNVTAAVNLICNGTATHYLYNPDFKENDWKRVVSAFCSHNYMEIFEEILDDPDVQEIIFEVDNTEDDVEWEELIQDFVKLSSLFTDLDSGKNSSRLYVKPNPWSEVRQNITLYGQNPSVMLFLLFNGILHRFCYRPDWQPKGLPNDVNFTEIHHLLCQMSEIKFFENFILNLTSGIKNSTEGNNHPSSAVLRNVVSFLRPIIKAFFGPRAANAYKNLESEFIYRSEHRLVETDDEKWLNRTQNAGENLFSLLDLMSGETLVENLFQSGLPFIVKDIVIFFQTDNKTLDEILSSKEEAKSLIKVMFQQDIQNRTMKKWMDFLVEYIDENPDDVSYICSAIQKNRTRIHRKYFLYCSIPPADLSKYIVLYFGNDMQKMFEILPSEAQNLIRKNMRHKQYKWMHEVFSAAAQQIAFMKLSRDYEMQTLFTFFQVLLKDIPELLEFESQNHCFAGPLPHVRIFNEVFLDLSKTKIDPEFLLCNLKEKNASLIYDWISEKFSFKNNVRKWKVLHSQTQDVNVCTEVAKVASSVLTFIEGLTGTLNSSEIDLRLCAKDAITLFIQGINRQGKVFQDVATLISKIILPSFGSHFTWDSLVSNFIRQLPGYTEVIHFEREISNETFDNVLPSGFEILRNLSLNLNWVYRHHFSSLALRNAICQEKNNRQFILRSDSREQTLLSLAYLCDGNNTEIFLSSLNCSEIEKQEKEFYAAGWLQYLLSHSHETEEDLKKAIHAIIELGADLSVNMFRKIMTAAGKHNLRILADSVDNLKMYLEPVFEGSQLLENLRIVVQGLRAVESLENLNFFDVGRKLKDLLKDTKLTEFTLKNEWNLTEDEVETILLMRVNGAEIFSENFLNAENVCLHFNPENTQRRKNNITEVLCFLDSRGELEDKTEVTQTVFFIDIIKNLVHFAFEGVLQKAGLTYTGVKATTEILGETSTVLPVIRKYLMTANTLFEKDFELNIRTLNIRSQGIGIFGTAEALKAGGRILCGRPFKTLQEKFSLLTRYENSAQLDNSELEKLPSEFCKQSYKQIMQVPGGPILWRFLKPLFLGKILYSPNTGLAPDVIKQMNVTFEAISDKIHLLQSISQSIVGLRFLEEKMVVLQNVKEVISSEIVKFFPKDIINNKSLAVIQAIDLSSFTDQLENVTDILEVVELLGNISECIISDRFLGFDSEEQLEKAAGRLHRDQEFIAGIVFLDGQKFSRIVRPGGHDFYLPSEVRYKIRMDIENVPSTKSLRYRWWRPYAYDDFFDDLRYLRGFIQLQEMIDSAILQVYTDNKPSINAKKYLQQFPYPCHQKDKFGTILKGSMPAVMTVSWIFVIAFLVREIVLERQLSLDEIMRVMGLRPLVAWLSWFLCGLLVLLVSVFGTVVILKSGSIMLYSDPVLLFIFILTFAVLLLSYCYLISVFFKSAPAAALIAIIIYVLSFFPFLLYITWEVHFFFWQKILACCLVATAFCFGCLFINRFEDQGEGIQWSNVWKSPVPDDNEMSLALALIIMISCSVAYFLVAWYISTVWPVGREFTKQPWYFVFSPTYWGFRKANHYVGNISVRFSAGKINLHEESQNHCVEDGNSLEKVGRKIGISVKNLHVAFHKGSSNEKKAVSDLNLKLYEGHITTLLGKNGAGKTTTIKVLTGRCRPTYGEIVVCGVPMTSNNMSSIRKFIGYCPQYNILYEKLTVREHLCFFARLKGVLSKEKLETDVDEMLENMGLKEKQGELTSYLSGGQKRRLCVALAFVGGSKVIILDEPTSSVDPVSRRDIWDLIVKYRKDRTILLCTHHLDEADILSDLVAVLHKGKLLCCGSPLQLKRKYGCGYILTMYSSPSLMSQEQINLGEMVPENSDHSEKQRGMDDNSILVFIQSHVPFAAIIERRASELVVSLPNETQDGKYPKFSKFFEALDSALNGLGFCSYSLSSTSLEQVFLTLCALADSKTSIKTEVNEAPNYGYYACGQSYYESSHSEEMRSSIDLKFSSKATVQGYKLKISQLFCLLTKRYHHTRRNWKMLMCTIVLPCLFIALAMSLTVGKPKPKPDLPLILDPAIYSPGSFSFIKSEASQPESVIAILNAIVYDPSNQPVCYETGNSLNVGCQNSSSKFRKILQGLTSEVQAESTSHKCICKSERCIRSASEPLIIRNNDVISNLTGYDVSQYLINTYLLFNEKRYGGWTFAKDYNGEEAVKIWFDNSGYHAMTSYLNTLNSAILKANMIGTSNSPNFGIVTYNHPIQLSAEQLGQETLLHRLSETGIAFVFLIGLSLIPSTFSLYIINERVSEEQRLQRIAGVGPTLYWCASILWDMFTMMIAVAFSALVIICFSLPTFVYRQNFLAVISLVFLFGWATTPMTYLLSKMFQEASLAFMVLFSGNLFIGLIIMLLVISLQLITLSNESHHVLAVVKKLALVFPQYSLVGGITDLAQNQVQSEILALFGQDTYVNPFTENLLLPNLFILTFQGLIFFIANILLEWRWASSCFRKSGSSSRDRIPTYNLGEKFHKNDILKIEGLEKVYKTNKGRKYALKELTVSVAEGECFGLLGINGAGKTTLFKILTGHTQHSKGHVAIDNEDIPKSTANGQELLGYCPQSDALDNLLTIRQHLYIYARLRGIPQEVVSEVVTNVLTSFDLHSYSDCQVQTLSGGNKRKVCTAIAMLGNPRLILLDEPTSGMDPVSRRLVWNRIRCATSEQKSVILSSHSIEECDILCSKIGIMVNGHFYAIGTPHDLKHKYGTGYTVTLRMRNNNWKLLKTFIKKNFPSAIIKGYHCSTVEFHLPNKDFKSLSTLFGVFEDDMLKMGVEDMSVDQTSLDQVFIDFSREQRDEMEEFHPSKNLQKDSSSSNRTAHTTMRNETFVLFNARSTESVSSAV